MESVLARYGSRITVTELSEALLLAVDEALAAETDAQLQLQLERLRVIRRTMLESERRVATLELTVTESVTITNLTTPTS
jgi:hypothetical protein